jgi:SNF2 family DNA or RNA helicase
MLIHEATKSVLLKVEDPFAIREILPKSKILPHPDYNIAIKHTPESVRVLKNVGFDVPTPMSTSYTWPGKYKPFSHQRVMAEFLASQHRAFNLSEMGVGKTAATLWAADHLMEQGSVKKVMILSPLSTLERVWTKDIFDVLMHRRSVIVHGSRAERMEALSKDVDFYILNHDGVKIQDVADEIRRREDINLFIVDEGSMFRNADSKKHKSLMKMLRPDVRLWWLTGTPCPNAPTDAWAQARIVSPERVPPYYGSFKRQTMMQITQFKWSPRPDSYTVAFDALQPAVRFKKADCLDLPPVITVDRKAEMSKEQLAAFTTMRNEMVAEAKEQQITAVNAADKINKLRQILCGAVKNPETEQYLTLPHAPRTEVLLECIEQASAKVLIIVPFKGIIQSLEKELQKHYSVGVLNGDVSPKMRDKIIRSFKETEDPHILLCHPKVMAHGLNLTEADTLIFYAPIYSNDEFQQVTERFNRTGQKRKMTIVRIGSHPLEWQIYKMVDQKRETQDNILSLYKSIVE